MANAQQQVNYGFEDEMGAELAELELQGYGDEAILEALRKIMLEYLHNGKRAKQPQVSREDYKERFANMRNRIQNATLKQFSSFELMEQIHSRTFASMEG